MSNQHLSSRPMRGVLAFIAFSFCVANSAVSQESQDWKSLFNGESFSGWVTEKGEPVEAGAWSIDDGMIHLETSKGRGGNLLSDRDYSDFELQFEWKLATGANNGIKYRVRDFDGRYLGLEYQMIDDQNHPNLKPIHATASIYDIYEPTLDDVLRPAGEFNQSRIVVHQNRIQHWLNGKLVATADVGSSEWIERISNSKFNDVAGFGLNQSGRIMLTDHHDEVWIRSMWIREIHPPIDANYPMISSVAVSPWASTCSVSPPISETHCQASSRPIVKCCPPNVNYGPPRRVFRWRAFCGRRCR